MYIKLVFFSNFSHVFSSLYKDSSNVCVTVSWLHSFFAIPWMLQYKVWKCVLHAIWAHCTVCYCYLWTADNSFSYEVYELLWSIYWTASGQTGLTVTLFLLKMVKGISPHEQALDFGRVKTRSCGFCPTRFQVVISWCFRLKKRFAYSGTQIIHAFSNPLILMAPILAAIGQ